MSDWLAVANTRTRRALGCAPIDRIAADRAAMLALPPVAPAIGWCSSLRLPRDHYIRLDSNDYSVHPGAVGRRVLVRADLDRVQAFCDGQTVAEHDPHLGHPSDHLRPGPRGSGEGIAAQTHPDPHHRWSPRSPVRNLSAYDAAFGVDLDGGAA